MATGGTSDCLDENTFVEFVEHRLRGEQHQRVEQHLAECSHCREIASELARPRVGEPTLPSAGQDSHQESHEGTPFSIAPSPPVANTVIGGKYRIGQIIGRGGMGIVLEATHLALDCPVAIKLLLAALDSPHEVRRRLIREARAAAQLRSEHVVRVFDVDTLASGEPYLVMELLEGSDLATRLRTEGPLPCEVVVEAIAQASDAIAEAHRRGIVHRDLKPANLFSVSRPSTGPLLIKVLDFGISKLQQTEEGSTVLTTSRSFLGSPVYMSPEQMCDPRHVDCRTDIWSLGATMYDLLTGRPPYEGPTPAAIAAAMATSPPPSVRVHNRGVPERLDKLIDRCLQRDPDKRFQNVDQLLHALAGVAAPATRDRIAHILARNTPQPSSTPRGRGVAKAPSAPQAHGSGGMLQFTKRWVPWAGAFVLITSGFVVTVMGHTRRWWSIPVRGSVADSANAPAALPPGASTSAPAGSFLALQGAAETREDGGCRETADARCDSAQTTAPPDGGTRIVPNEQDAPHRAGSTPPKTSAAGHGPSAPSPGSPQPVLAPTAGQPDPFAPGMGDRR